MNRVSQFSAFSALITTLIGMTSCGESFTGVFNGNGSYYVQNCNQIQRISDANIQLRLTISGDEAEIVVLSIKNNSSASDYASQSALTGLRRNVSLSNDTQLTGNSSNEAPDELEPSRFYPIYHVVNGNVATDRSVIDNLDLEIRSVDATHPPEAPCVMRIQASHLEFVE